MVGQGDGEADADDGDSNSEENADDAAGDGYGIGDFASDTLEPPMSGQHQMGQMYGKPAYEEPQTKQQYDEPEVKQEYEEPPGKKAYEEPVVQQSNEKPDLKEDYQEAEIAEPMAQKSETPAEEPELEEQAETAPGEFSLNIWPIKGFLCKKKIKKNVVVTFVNESGTEYLTALSS